MDEKKLGFRQSVALGLRYWPTFIKLLPKLYVERFNQRKELGFPRIITVFATERCNMRCPMCLVWKSREQFGADGETITAESMRPVLDEAEPWGTGFYFTGGEPLMNREVPDIIAMASQRRLLTGLTTNGLLLKKRAQELLDAGLTFLSVSIDAREPVHDANRGLEGAFAHAVAGIEAMQDIAVLRRSVFPIIKLNATFFPESLGDLEYLVALAGRLGVAEITFQHLSFVDDVCREPQRHYAEKLPYGDSFQGMDVGERCFSPEQIQRIAAFMANAPELEAQHGVKVGFGPSTNSVEGYYTPGFPSRQSFCSIPWSELSIRANGDLEMCHGHVIGNITSSRVHRAWKSPVAKEFRSFIARHPNAPPCYRCCALKYHFAEGGTS
ncbi:radical SAM protein [Desulfobaculum sp.]